MRNAFRHWGLGLVIAWAAAAVVMPGCLDVHQEVQVAADGSARLTMKTLVGQLPARGELMAHLRKEVQRSASDERVIAAELREERHADVGEVVVYTLEVHDAADLGDLQRRLVPEHLLPSFPQARLDRWALRLDPTPGGFRYRQSFGFAGAAVTGKAAPPVDPAAQEFMQALLQGRRFHSVLRGPELRKMGDPAPAGQEARWTLFYHEVHSADFEREFVGDIQLPGQP